MQLQKKKKKAFRIIIIIIFFFNKKKGEFGRERVKKRKVGENAIKKENCILN